MQLSNMQTQINIDQAQSKIGFDPFDVETQLPAHPFSMSQVCNKISAQIDGASVLLLLLLLIPLTSVGASKTSRALARLCCAKMEF